MSLGNLEFSNFHDCPVEKIEYLITEKVCKLTILIFNEGLAEYKPKTLLLQNVRLFQFNCEKKLNLFIEHIITINQKSVNDCFEIEVVFDLGHGNPTAELIIICSSVEVY